MERTISSTGCSTSYASARELRAHVLPSCRRRGRARCLAQSRGYHASPSPERDPSRNKHAPVQRLSQGSVAAKAVSTPRKDAIRSSLHRDLITTNIPDSIPSLEELEDLRNRVLQQGARGGRSISSRRLLLPSLTEAPQLEPDIPSTTPTLTPLASPSPHDGHVAPPPSTRVSASGSSTSLDPSSPSKPPSSATRPPPTGRSALSAVVPLPVPLTKPQPGGPQRSGSPPQHSSFARPPPRRPYGKPQPSVMQLTLAIKGVQDWRQLPRLLVEAVPRGEGLDPFNAAAFLTHLAQRVAVGAQPLTAADVVALERMQATALAVVEPNMHEYRARQVSNISWALARLGLPSGAAFLREHLMPAAYALLPWYEPQHLSNTVWSLAASGVAPDDGWLEEYLTAAFVTLQRRAFAPQHLANVLWALERMGVMPDQEWMAAFYDCVAASLPSANAQDCSNVLSSLALMSMHNHAPDATAVLATRVAARLTSLLTASTPASSTASPPSATAPEELGSAVLTPTPTRRGASATATSVTATTATSSSTSSSDPGGVSDQSIANSLWALAVMGVDVGGGVWDAAAGALRSRLSDFTRPSPGVQPAALTTVLWAAATVRRPLPATVMNMVYGRVHSAQLEAMEGRGVATMVWALATAHPDQARPSPEWVAEVVAVSGRSVATLGSQAVSNLLYGLCVMGARPPPSWMSAVINHFHRNVGAEASCQSVANVLWCLAKMGYRLNSEGMDILAGLVLTRLEDWAAQRAAPQVMAAASAAAQKTQQGQQREGSQREQPVVAVPPPFSAQEVSNVLYALAVMGYAADPAGGLARQLLAAARARLREANAQELSNTMWSLAALQIRPSDAWLGDYYAAAAARLPSFQPKDLAQSLYAAAKLRLPLTPSAAPSSSLPATATPKPKPSTKSASAASATLATPAAAGSAWTAAALAAAPRLLSSASAQDLCNLSWALVQLQLPVEPDSKLALAFAARLVALSSGCEPPQLALGVWALGKWGVRPSRSQLQQLEVTTFRQVPSMRPHELAAMLSGFAGMGHTPPTEWLEDTMQQVAVRSRDFGPQDWTVVLHSLARCQDESIRPQAEDLAQRLLPRLHRLPLAALVLLSYSCGCMGPTHTSRQLVSRCLTLLAGGDAASPAQAAPPPPPVKAVVTAGKGVRRAAQRGWKALEAAAPEGRMVLAGEPISVAGAEGEVAAAAADAVERLLAAAAAAGPPHYGSEPDALLSASAVAVAEPEARPVAVSSLTATELSALLWAAVRVGIKVLPNDFRAQFLRQTAPQLPSLPASLAVSYLWTAGRLRMWLPWAWRRAVVGRAEATLGDMRGKELAMCLSGLIWLRVFPSRRMLDSLAAALEQQGPSMHEKLGRHATDALQVLERRVAKARLRRRMFGDRRMWVLRTRARTGTAEAGAALRGKGLVNGGEGGESADQAAAGQEVKLTKKGALRLGVLRRRPSRLTGAAAVQAGEL